jgi:hypothetical protein
MSWFKRLFQFTPTKDDDTDDPTGGEDRLQNDGEEDLRQGEYLSGGAGVPGVAAPEAAETAEEELSEYEKPQDLAP